MKHEPRLVKLKLILCLILATPQEKQGLDLIDPAADIRYMVFGEMKLIAKTQINIFKTFTSGAKS